MFLPALKSFVLRPHGSANIVEVKEQIANCTGCDSTGFVVQVLGEQASHRVLIVVRVFPGGANREREELAVESAPLGRRDAFQDSAA